MTKEKVIDLVKEMPEGFSTEELIERIILVEKIEKGISEVKEGKTISLEEARKKIESSVNIAELQKLKMKEKLKKGFEEVEAIIKGEKKGESIDNFLSSIQAGTD